MANLRIAHSSERDYPRGLRLNLAACAVARSIYYAASDVERVCRPDFESLPPEDKQRYLGLATRAIQGAIVTPCVTGLRPTHTPVIGVIEPRQPGGAA